MDQENDKPACKVLLAGTIAKSLLESVKSDVQDAEKLIGRPPKLVAFLANSDPAARLYSDWTEKACQDSGVNFELREVDKDDVEEQVMAANNEAAVDGIIIYFPVFGNRQDQYLQQVTDATKDVEGLCHKYVFNMYQNIRYLDERQVKKSILPCTPLAVVKILEYLTVYNPHQTYGNRLFGRTITIVNRSEIVGRPLAALLANDGANVYSVDLDGMQHFTRGQGIKKRRHQVVGESNLTIKDVAPQSDVIITGVPSKQYKFPTELVKDGAICINFSSEKNFDLSVKEKASIYVPSIGKVTNIILLRNLARLVQNNQPTS